MSLGRRLLAVLGMAILPALVAGCVHPGTSVACTAPLRPALEVNLYFGRDKPAGGEVSEAEWASFVAESVTPQFPAGLSVLDVEGQYRDPSGRIGRERSKLLIVVVFDAPAHHAKVAAVVAAYSRRFGQHSVFRVEQPACAGI